MSVDPDQAAVCPKDEAVGFAEGEPCAVPERALEQKKKRSVRFPGDNQLVTAYFEPANPWHDVPNTTRAQLAQEYLLSCRQNSTVPIDSVLLQIRELPESSIGGAARAPRLVLADCCVCGAGPADALEALLKKVQFRRIELDHAELDDEGAEALFDMVEYYESANAVSITGPRLFGIRGWQAASRMIKKSSELSEVEVAESPLETSHAPVLARALKPITCRLRALCLQRASLSGDPLMCLVIALKFNTSIRELRLPDNTLTPHDAQQLGSLLRFNPNVQLLDLSNNQIQDLGVSHIADAIADQSSHTSPSAVSSPMSPQLHPQLEVRGLAFLVLWNNQLTRNSAPHLNKALRSSHVLCVLNVGRNALGSDAVRSLQSGASHGGGRALLSLGLQCARLGADAGPPLADLLRADTKLQRLDLRDNRLGAAGLQALHNAMKDNSTITQIDLDDPADSSTLSASDSEAAVVARLTLEIRALCRLNEPPATEPQRRAHRKISLTCHTACVLKQPPLCAGHRRGSRLRSPLPSPAPSPAGSPVPHHQHVQVNRFSVSRVTPERESSTESSSPTTPTRPCGTPSRFKVVQVAEPPAIQVHPAKRSSRFSVTRNYDSIYDPSPRSSPSASPSPSVSPCPSDSYSDKEITRVDTPRPVKSSRVETEASPSVSPCPSDSYSETDVTIDTPRTVKIFDVDSENGRNVSPCPSDSYSETDLRIDTPRAVKCSKVNIEARRNVSPCPGDSSNEIGKITMNVRSSRVENVSPCPSESEILREANIHSEDNSSVTVSPCTSENSDKYELRVSKFPRVSNPRAETSPSVSPCPSDSYSETDTRVLSSRGKASPSSSPCPIDSFSDKEDSKVPSNVGIVNVSPCSSYAYGEKSTLDQISSLNTIPMVRNCCTFEGIQTLSTKMEPDTRIPRYNEDDISRVSINYENDSRLHPSDRESDANVNITESKIENPTVELDTTPTPEVGLQTTIDCIDSNQAESNIDDKINIVPEISKESIHNKNIEKVPYPEVKRIASTTTLVGKYSETAISKDRSLSGTCYRYESPSITTLSGALLSRNAEMSSTTLCPTENCSKNSADTKISDVSSKNISAIPISADSIKNNSAIPISIPRSESFGLLLNADPTMSVSKSRFSISPCSSFLSNIDQFYKKPEDIKQTDIRNVPITKRSQNETDVRNISNKTTQVICDAKAASDRPVYSGSEIATAIATKIETEISDFSICQSEDISKVVDVPKDTDSCIDATAIYVRETDKNMTKLDNDDMKQNIPKENKCNRREDLKIIKTKEIDTPKVITSDVKEMKVVEFAAKPEDVIFFIADEPICRSGKLMSDKNTDANTSDVIVSVGQTYSDVLKTDYKDKSEHLTHEQNIDDEVVKTETKLVKKSVEISDSDKVDVKVEVTVKSESVKPAKVHSDKDFVNIDDILIRKDDKALKKIEAITEDLGNLIQEMKVMSSKKKCTVDVGLDTNIVPGSFNRDIVLKKNKSESSLDSPDLEVSRLMNKNLVGSPFRDSSSSLEISGSSMESLNAVENVPKTIIVKSPESDMALDRRKDAFSAESSVESTSDATPVNTQNFLYMSVSSNESVSPIPFGKTKKIHGSLSSLEASVSSLDSKQDKLMVTSADSGIEHSLQQTEVKDDASSNEGTLTHNSSLRETVKRSEFQETLTSLPKRASSLLDVPTLKSKGLDRMRKISWVAPSPSFHMPREPEKKEEKPSHLEKLLSLFQHPTSLFTRSQSDDERKSASNTPPRKDSSLTSSFWSWGSAIENYKEEKEDSSEATDSTLSERVQVSFVDESFSKKLDSKTPSTDTDNTLSEFQSFSQNAEEKVTDTTDVLVQKCLDLSLTDNAGIEPKPSDIPDLSKPNDINKNEPNRATSVDCVDKSTNVAKTSDTVDKFTDTPVALNENKVRLEGKEEIRLEAVRPRSFAAVLKASGSENSIEKQISPDSGQLVDKLPVKVIRGIKENISPENTLTASMTNTQALAEISVKHQPIVGALWEMSIPKLEKNEPKTEDVKSDLAPIATIEETCDIVADNFSSETIQLGYIDDAIVDIQVRDVDDEIVTEGSDLHTDTAQRLENVDLGKDALSYLIYESQDFEPDTEHTVPTKVEQGSLAQELQDAAIKEMIDLSPELVIDEAIEVFPVKELKALSPVIPDRAKIKSNSLEDLSQKDEKSPKTKSIAFKVPETSPRDIPERRSKLRSRSGSSPKSLPESLNKPCPLSKMDAILSKKKKKVSSLGKMARDSLLALNMSEEEIAEFRRSCKLTSVESLRSLESVSEDANSQSGTSFDSRCRACFRTSQESLMSLDSITEDCKCDREERDKRSNR